MPPLHLDFFDSGRSRPVPVSFHPPAPGTPRPWPLVVFSPGFGGGREGYGGLARAWAAAGLAVAVLEHSGSGPEALARLNLLPRAHRSEALYEWVRDPEEVRARAGDVAFVLDRLAEEGRVDPDRVGLAGHSYGACTALAVGGVPVTRLSGGPLRLGDPRVRAVQALSPPSPGLFFADEDHGRLEVPALLITGDLDFGPFRDSPREDRTRAFPLLPRDRAWMAVFRGADHMTFAEMGLRHRRFMEPLQGLTSAWWRWALAGGAAPDSGWVAREVGGPELVAWSEPLRPVPGPSAAPPG